MFQSRPCRGTYYDSRLNRFRSHRHEFQSPPCRGTYYDLSTTPHTELVHVSIPYVSGHLLRLTGWWRRIAWSRFQSPPCRGTYYDKAISILLETLFGFNPLRVGAPTTTCEYRGIMVEAMQGGFNPLRVGAPTETG